MMPLQLATDVTLTETDSGSVLLDQRDGRYWMLNSSGSIALRLMLEGRTLRQAADDLRGRFPDGAPRAEQDVQELVDALRAAKLVTP